jgi:hypothetical protein
MATWSLKFRNLRKCRLAPSRLGTGHVRADLIVCPAERSSAKFFLDAMLKPSRAAFDWTDEDIFSYVSPVQNPPNFSISLAQKQL